MRLPRILALAVALLCAPYVADASPIKISFAGLLTYGPPSPVVGDPWNGFGISGFFVYDDLFGGNGYALPEGQGGCSPNCDNYWTNKPMTDFLLNIGSYRYTFADAEGGGGWVGGVLGNQFWGPGISIKPERLPSGMPFAGLGTTGSTIAYYDGGIITTIPFIVTPVVSVPEPSSLLFGAGALGLLLLKRKRGALRRLPLGVRLRSAARSP